MNIGIVTMWFERGAGYVSRAYMEVLSRQHSVFIYARGSHYAIGDPKWDRDNVTWSKRVSTATSDTDWDDFSHWALERELDIIIFNEQRHWDIILKCQHLGLLIGTYVDYYTTRTVSFFTLYDFLLCNTQRHYSVFQHHPQAFYIPWGTDCTVFVPHWTDRVDGVRFFHSAGMAGVNLRKGTDLLVEAFQSVRGNARLIIHSQVGLESYGRISQIIERDPRIEFIEGDVEAPGLYHLGDVYVYPTKLEGIGLTVPEALACGLPVITTDEAPMNEFVKHGETGRLVPLVEQHLRSDLYYWPESICSVPALTEAMQLYVDKPDLIDTQRQNARDYAVNNLDWEKNSQGICELFNNLKPERVSPWSLRARVIGTAMLGRFELFIRKCRRRLRITQGIR